MELQFAYGGRDIQGTDNPALFQEGREGKFHCRFPAPLGKYQLKILFADTAGDKEAARQVDFNINDRRADAPDVVDDAGGDDAGGDDAEGDDAEIGKVYSAVERWRMERSILTSRPTDRS